MKKNCLRRMAVSLTALTTLCVAPAASLSAVTATAADSVFPYTMYASSSITVNAKHLCMNGSMASKGSITTPKQSNINGQKKENVDLDMVYIGSKLDSAYFGSAEAVEFVNIKDHNINLNKAMDVKGTASFDGNLNLNTSIKADEDIHISGNVSNANNTVLYSEFGDIIIDSNNVNLNGLVYAPMGSVIINANNINLNNVCIIADSIVLTSNNVNANYGSNFARAAGTESTETASSYMLKYNKYKMYKDIDDTLNTLGEYYNVTPIDAGEYANLSIMGMAFDVQQYNVEGYGNLSIMVLDNPMMQMSTIVLTPFYKDMPLISTDFMYSGGTRTDYVEFYEVCADANDAGYQATMGELSTLLDKYSCLEDKEMDPAWYDAIRPIGLFKKLSYTEDDIAGAMLNDSIRITMEHSKNMPTLEGEQREAKHDAVQSYANDLVDKGGISTNMFKMALGVEKTKDFFNSVFFGTTKF